ncbi:uncharacterized protein LOC123563178 isoform X4 [Mercenaria mercenaria]|uniref:uncharacterized protein LOC123563178 isoform X4 n=1 Tax=Mercenaria mercenaria TaxID=6596 RepID=UPI00234E3C6F|nr:uncharacterized protein LOC123563178 isoform X4 [Mercenaria mercenaria]
MQQKKIYSLYIKYRHLCYMFLEFTLNGMEFLRGKKRTLSPDPPEEPLRKVIRRGSVQESARGNAINRQRKRGIDRHDGARGGTRGRKMPKQNGTRRHGRARRTRGRVDRLNNFMSWPNCIGNECLNRSYVSKICPSELKLENIKIAYSPKALILF